MNLPTSSMSWTCPINVESDAASTCALGSHSDTTTCAAVVGLAAAVLALAVT